MSETQFHTDGLTKLLNRSGVEYELALYDQHKHDVLTSAFSVQVSRFGQVNTSLGASSANKIIAKIAKRLVSLFPNAKVLARTHGDNFFVAFGKESVIEEEVDRLMDFTQRPLIVGGKVMVVSVKVGFVGEASAPKTYSAFLHATEVALDEAKLQQRQNCEYSSKLQRAAIVAHELENDLRISLVHRHQDLHNGLINSEFSLHYQPIINSETDKVEYFEALMRWQHPSKGQISPSVFIPVAEQIQVIDTIGNWVILRAIADAKQWNLLVKGKPVGVSINVSALQIAKPDVLLGVLSSALEKHQFDPSLVKIEVTESFAFTDGYLDTLKQVRKLGCEIALDDFGTGHSSLTQIHQMPLDYLKLDRSFIGQLTQENKKAAFNSIKLTEGILMIAKTFGLKSVIEGVESIEQLEILKSMGAELIQGFYYSKPLAFEKLPDYLLINEV